MIEFILVKLPVILWALISFLTICIDFVGGLCTAVLIGVPVAIWVLVMKYFMKNDITYYVHLDSKQVKKLKKKRKKFR